MCDCYLDPPTFYEAHIVKGRKPHKCSECLCVIEKGEHHEYVRGLWEGDFDQFRTCSKCLTLRHEIKIDCFAHSQLMDELDDHLDTPSVIEFFERRQTNWERLKREREQWKMIANGA